MALSEWLAPPGLIVLPSSRPLDEERDWLSGYWESEGPTQLELEARLDVFSPG